jgi:hypothetical protein
MVLLGNVFNYVLYRHAQFRQDGIPICDIVDNRFNQLSHQEGGPPPVEEKKPFWNRKKDDAGGDTE